MTSVGDSDASQAWWWRVGLYAGERQPVGADLRERAAMPSDLRFRCSLVFAGFRCFSACCVRSVSAPGSAPRLI
jgi:hypothetical protein